jgi:hypothetical protein
MDKRKFILFLLCCLNNYVTSTTIPQILVTEIAHGAKPYDQFGHAIAVTDEFTAVSSPALYNELGMVQIFSTDENTVVNEENSHIISSLGPHGYFGHSLALMENTLFVGAPYETCSNGESDCGAVWVYVETPRIISGWSIESTIYSTQGFTQPERFGLSLGVTETALFIGAPNAEYLEGAVYMYVRNSYGGWQRMDTLQNSRFGMQGRFGYSISIHNTLIAIGVPYDIYESSMVATGSIHLFYINGGTSCSFHQILFPSDVSMHSNFGISLSVADDMIVVGAPSGNGHSLNTGAAYVFRRVDEFWSIGKLLIAHDGTSGDQFGCSVGVKFGIVAIGACAEQGKMTASGSIWQASDGNACGSFSKPDCQSYNDRVLFRGQEAGALYVFETQTIGNLLDTEIKILPAFSGLGWKFGSSVIVNNDAILVGAEGASAGSDLIRAGSIYKVILTRESTNDISTFSAGVLHSTHIIISVALSCGLIIGIIFILYHRRTPNIIISEPHSPSQHGLLVLKHDIDDDSISMHNNFSLIDLEKNNETTISQSNKTQATTTTPTTTPNAADWGIEEWLHSEIVYKKASTCTLC